MLLGTGDALGDALRVAIRWTHAVATVAWVGGSLFYLAALRPALRSSGAGPEVERAIAGRFREVVEASLVALVVTGVLLTFDRLSSGAAGPAYVVVLGAKVLLALAMCWLARGLGRAGRRRRPPEPARRSPGRLSPSRLVVALGLLVVLLATVLRQVFEAGLRGA